LRDENLPLSTKRFDAVAKIAADDMRAPLAGGQGKTIHYSYISATENTLCRTSASATSIALTTCW
jgi:hypothetical protein